MNKVAFRYRIYSQIRDQIADSAADLAWVSIRDRIHDSVWFQVRGSLLTEVDQTLKKDLNDR